MERAFRAYVQPLSIVMSFNYLGRILMSLENEWPELVGNLGKARKKWECMLRILEREREYAWTSGTFLNAVVQAFLLFGYETWAMKSRMVWTRGRFQHRVAHLMMGKQLCWIPEDGWK